MEYRLAKKDDIEQLIKMRWDFTVEDYPEMGEGVAFSAFAEECSSFLEQAIDNGQWFIWVAEDHEKIVSHIYVELIQKVPRPGRVTNPFAYMTNVYTIPCYRGKGIGSQLLSSVNEWAKDQKYEFIIVWPSDTSIEFYSRNGYANCKEPMERQF
ncbi:GNAT family N-acetyltransferase [Mesobacillus subterraneus]|uniref:GNAT family N-acetyltransferase n=1 Tax=Mesobacillus subterraneus TaxID=285983 RepID=A0A427TWZ4_9BACI|nr:GNAT family N-acetyltransferase [Mesobacillus subterraneus]RSD28836.1 GNAT family N-acetyltransferase [Mesobacillus subterraneus]